MTLRPGHRQAIYPVRETRKSCWTVCALHLLVECRRPLSLSSQKVLVIFAQQIWACTCLGLDRIEIFDLHTQSDGVESRRCTDFARQPCSAQVLPFQSSRPNANPSIVSGEPPKHPVFSKVTGTICDMTCELINAGNVFEKHLLESYLAENQTDPVTNEPATVEDYIELKGFAHLLK